MSDFAEGTVHRAADDLKAAIRADAEVLALWQGLTPLGRNEFICWVEDAKQAPTRAPHPPHHRGDAGGQAPAVLLVRLHPP